MPYGVNEEKWEKAKEIAAKAGHKRDWRYIRGIYNRMAHDGKSEDAVEAEALKDLDQPETFSLRESTIFIGDGLNEAIDEPLEKGFAVVKQAVVNFYKKPDADAIDAAYNLFHIAKRALVIGSAALVNPVLGLFAWFADYKIAKNVGKKQQAELMHKFQTEAAEMDEKIKDLDQRISELPDGPKKKRLQEQKYAYIRVRSKVQQSIEKLEHNLVVGER